MSQDRIQTLISKVIGGTKPRVQIQAYADLVRAITAPLPDELSPVEQCYRIPIIRFRGEIKVLEHFLDNGLFPADRNEINARLKGIMPKWKDFLHGYGLNENPLPALELVEMVWPSYRVRCPMFTDHCIIEECKPVDCHSLMRFSNADEILRTVDEKWLGAEKGKTCLSLLTWLRDSYFGGPFGYRRSAGIHVPSAT